MSRTTPDTSPATETAPAAPLGWWGWTWRSIVGFFVLLVLYVGVRLLYEQALAPFYAPVPAITIGHDTTRIDGPLDAEGYVDYIAAVDAAARVDVTPENNAAVLLFEAVGSSEIASESERQKYFGKLGMPIPPAEGEYLSVAIDDPEIRDKTGFDQQQRDNEVFSAETRPWTRSEFPPIAAQVDRNEKPLAKIVAASRRPRWYSPLMEQDGAGALLNCEHYHGTPLSAACKALSRRAMLRIGQSDLDGALADAEAIDRLGHLVSQGPSIYDWLVQVTCFQAAARIRRTLAVDARLTPEQLARFRASEQSRPAPADLVPKVDRFERFCFTGSVQFVARGASNPPTALIDWNLALQEGHPWFDRSLDTLCEKDPRARRRAIEEQFNDFSDYYQRNYEVTYWIGSWLGGESLRSIRGRRTGAELTTLNVPPIGALVLPLDLWHVRHDLNTLAFALAEYRFARGTHPEKLAELVPDFLPQLSIDPLAETAIPYGYERTAEGYVLFSHYKHSSEEAPALNSESDEYEVVVRKPARPLRLPF